MRMSTASFGLFRASATPARTGGTKQYWISVSKGCSRASWSAINCARATSRERENANAAPMLTSRPVLMATASAATRRARSVLPISASAEASHIFH